MSFDTARLLIAEDHAALAGNLAEFFDDDRFILDFAADGLTALHLATVNRYDVIVLDVMLPGIDGFEICRRLREDIKCRTPIIMMTARDLLQDKEQGYGAGADDYLVKPFQLKELQLRIQALLRRGSSASSILRAGSLSFDPGTLQAKLNDSSGVELFGTPARIYEQLIRAYPNFVSYEELQQRVWGDREADLHLLRTHVYTLRRLLHERFELKVIRTLHGRGYILCPPLPFPSD